MAKFLKNTLGQTLVDSQGRKMFQGTLTKLSAPTNVSVSGTTAEFDSVDNATKYTILVDGSSIGDYQPT